MHLVAIGGSDAGISAALRARELDPATEVTVVVADAYPNFSICGIPYYVSGEVTHWRNLAHRTIADLEATGMQLRLDTVADASTSAATSSLVVDADGHRGASRLRRRWSSAPGRSRSARRSTGSVGAGRPRARRRRPPAALDGRHLRRHAHPRGAQPGQRGDRRRRLHRPGDGRGLSARGSSVTQIEQLPEVLPTVDPELGALVHAELTGHGVDVRTATTVTQDRPGPGRLAGPLQVEAIGQRRRRSIALRRPGPGRRRRAPGHRARRLRPAPSSGSTERSASTGTCGPTCRTSSPPVTAS